MFFHNKRPQHGRRSWTEITVNLRVYTAKETRDPCEIRPRGPKTVSARARREAIGISVHTLFQVQARIDRVR